MTFRKSHPPVGARPGTLAIPPDSPPPVIRLVCYDANGIEERDVDDVETLAGLRDDRVAWVDVRGLGDEALLRRIGEIFAIHPLALEDAVNVPQRASLDALRTATGDRGARAAGRRRRRDRRPAGLLRARTPLPDHLRGALLRIPRAGARSACAPASDRSAPRAPTISRTR